MSEATSSSNSNESDAEVGKEEEDENTKSSTDEETEPQQGTADNESDEDEFHDVTLDMVRNDKKAFHKAIRKRFSLRMQVWALICKNTTLQRRSWCTNICQCLIPIGSLLIILVLQAWVASLITQEIEESRYPITNPPFTILTKPEDGIVFTPPIEFLYWQDDPADDIGSYPYGNATASGLLGQIPNTNVTFKFVSYDGSLINIKDLERVRDHQSNFTFIKKASKQDVDKELFDNFYDPPVYANAFEFVKISVPALDFQIGVLANSSLTRGRDIVGALSLITSAIVDSIPNPIALFQFLGVKKTATPHDSNDFDLASLAGSLFYCLILHQLLPVFMNTIVYEKENRLREMMKMMGLKMPLYWIVQYVWFYVLYCFVIAFLTIGGYVLRFRFFTVNSPFLYIMLFIIWGHTLIAMSFLLSVFFSKARTSTIVGYFLVLALSFIGSYCVDALVSNFDTSQGILFIISCVPSFAVYRGLVYLGTEVSFRGPGMKISDATNSDLNIASVYGYLLVEWFIMIALAFYLDQVWPSTYGVRRHPLFFLGWIKKIPPFTYLFKKKHNDADPENVAEMPNDVGKAYQDAHSDDVYALKVQSLVKQYEKKAIDSFPLSLWRPLVKYFTCGKKQPKQRRIKSAVDNISYALNENECIGILGPNGAGKTSMISILCGLFKATSGKAEIYGMDLYDNISSIHMLTGVCPQHDVLWENMTGAEHLYFYGRLKNLSGKRLKRAVKKALAAVRLTGARNKLSSKYSGGMKRRLSVAISLIGNPKLVFLDEPSTGLDPKSKRALWQVIASKKKKCAIILTTHSMEEAEALCDKLMIMSKGKLKAIGVSSELKNRFGEGYKFTVHTHPEYAADAANFVEQLLPNATLLNSLAGMSNYSVQKEGVVVSKVFFEMEKNKERLHIDDWGICNTTLEEVFHSIVADDINDALEIGSDDSDDESEQIYQEEGEAKDEEKEKEDSDSSSESD